MKLLAKYSRINLFVTILIFLVSSAAYYFLLNYILVQQVDDDLKIEEQEINAYAKKYSRLPESMPVNDQVISYIPVISVFNGRSFFTGNISQKNEKGPYRQLSFGITSAGRNYRVNVAKSLKDTEALIQSILLITFLTILTILIASFIINRLVIQKIWQPFYTTLKRVENFKLAKKEKFYFEKNSIEEFNLMNQTIEKLINRAQLDYLSLKTFSENASHEIQTPLAVIRAKLDILVQDEDLTEKQSKALQSSYTAVEKLARLNQSLLLLTKIENDQFADRQLLDMKQSLEDKVTEFHELWQSQVITVHASLETKLLSVNGELLDILLNNLLSNASKYNYEGGNIHIELTNNHLQIANTSHHPPLEQDRVFQRFYKTSNNNYQNGLGLSIIKQICDDAGFNIAYCFNNDQHQFVIRFH